MTTALANALTQRHRAEQLAVRAKSLRGLMQLWRAVDPTDLSGTIDTFTEAAVLLARSGNQDSAAVGARYYRMFRTASGVTGAAPAVLLDGAPSREYAAGQLRGAALSGIVNGRRAGLSLPRALSNGLVKVIGTMSKLVLAGGQMTIISAAKRDPKALGWTRVTSSDPCAFCRMLAGRGPAYKTKKSADFESHGGCGCTTKAVFEGADSAQADYFSAEYKAAQAWARTNVDRGNRTTDNDALNNYRLYIARTGGTDAPIPALNR